MALSRRIEEARRASASRENRESQHRAELRLSEIVKTYGIADEYIRADAAEDTDMKVHFGRMYHAAPNEEMRVLISRAFAAWDKHDKKVDGLVNETVGAAVQLLKDNNIVWLNGAAVPVGSDGVA